MRGLDLRIHPASQRVLRRRWMAGSSPAKTHRQGSVFAATAATPELALNRTLEKT
jgi:hypothetical protein